MDDIFFQQLEMFLKHAADEEETPEGDVVEGLETAKNDATKNEILPDLGEGDDILNPSDEEAFGPALSPSKWQIEKSGDGYIVFNKTDSKSDPKAAQGRYEKKQNMDTGVPDEKIIDYINSFLSLNKIDPQPISHLTMKTPFGPKATDKYDNDISVDHLWKDGKYKTIIRWRKKDTTIQVPPQFKKEIPVPDELAPQPEEVLPEMPEVDESIPSLDELDSFAPTEENEEVNEEPEEPEETEEEKPEKASVQIRLLKLSHHVAILSKKDISLNHVASLLNKLAHVIFAADDDDQEEREDTEEDEEQNRENEKEEKDDDEDFDKAVETDEKQDEKQDEEVEEDLPPSADITEIVNNLLSKPTDSGKTTFDNYINTEALATGVLYPRDFKDLENYRKDGDLDKLRDKESAMADRIYGDIDRILKSTAPDDAVKKRIGEMSKSDLTDIISDNLEQISSSDTDHHLSSPVKLDDIAEVPEEDQEVEEDTNETPSSPVDQLVDLFYQIRGSINPSQRTENTDMKILEMARDKFDENNPDNNIEDDDFYKAKQLISNDLEGRGDLVGNP